MAKEAQQLVAFTATCMLISVCMAATTTTSNIGNRTLSKVPNVQKILEILTSNTKSLNKSSSTRSFGDRCDFATISTGGLKGLNALATECNPTDQGMMCAPDSECACFDSNKLLLGSSYKAVRDYAIIVSGLTITDEDLKEVADAFLIKGEYDSDSKTCLAAKDSLCSNQVIPQLPDFSFNCKNGLECKQLDPIGGIAVPVGKCTNGDIAPEPQDPCDYETIAKGGVLGLAALTSECEPARRPFMCGTNSKCTCFDSTKLLSGPAYENVRNYILDLYSITNGELEQFAREVLIQGQYDSSADTCRAVEGSLCTVEAIPGVPNLQFSCASGLTCERVSNPPDGITFPVGKCNGGATVLFSLSVAILSVVMHLIS